MRAFLEAALIRKGYPLELCARGDEALACIQRKAFDMVILDVVLPDMDGYEVMSRIHELQPELVVIIISGHASLDSALKALRGGAYDYLRKPFGNQELLTTVENASRTIQLKAENKLALKALRQSEEKYRTLVDNIPDVLAGISRFGRFTAISGNAIDHYGYTQEQLTGKRVIKCLHPQDRDQAFAAFRESVLTREKNRPHLRFRVVAKDGTHHWVEVNISHSYDDKGHYLHSECVIRDINETRKLQDELVRSERLAATGQLASFVAHEINSPLQAITVLLHTLEKQSDDKGITEKVGVIRGAFNSIRATVMNLLDLNRMGNEEKQATNVNAVLQQTVELVSGYLKKNRVALKLDLDPSLPKIFASPRQLNQVFLNLINNAIQAISDSDDIQQGWRSRKQMEGQITVTTRYLDKQIIIRIVDEGPGIDADQLANIFEPFYTGKKERGMGVGLSICYQIIDQHHGDISAAAPETGGMVFTVKLPAEKMAVTELRK